MNDTGINAADLKRFPRPVAKILADAINNHDVAYRMIDGSHIRLFCGDRTVTPAKVAAERPAEDTMRVLLPWLERNTSWLEHEVTEDAIETLASVVNSQPQPVKAKAVVQDVPEEEEIDPRRRCTWKGCDFIAKTAGGLNMHTASHTGAKKEYAKKATETAVLRREQRKVIATSALTALAELHGLNIGGEPDEKRVKELEAQVVALTKERDNALARVALLNEAFKGLE